MRDCAKEEENDSRRLDKFRFGWGFFSHAAYYSSFISFFSRVFLFSPLFQLQVARLFRLRILNKFSTWFRIDNRSSIGCHCNIVDCWEVKSWGRMRRLQFGNNRRITGRRQARSQWMFLFFYSFFLDPQQVLLQVIWAFFCCVVLRFCLFLGISNIFCIQFHIHFRSP